jgi:hypothetical protein
MIDRVGKFYLNAHHRFLHAAWSPLACATVRPVRRALTSGLHMWFSYGLMNGRHGQRQGGCSGSRLPGQWQGWDPSRVSLTIGFPGRIEALQGELPTATAPLSKEPLGSWKGCQR